MDSEQLQFRVASRGDLEGLVALLAADPLGALRERAESPLPASYVLAFEAIEADPHNDLLIAERAGELLGLLQLTRIPNLTYEGSWRAQIEGVRVAASARGQGVGRALVEEAVRRARHAGCRMVQLTTDKQRPEALCFYEALGFRASHEGLKRHLERPVP